MAAFVLGTLSQLVFIGILVVISIASAILFFFIPNPVIYREDYEES